MKFVLAALVALTLTACSDSNSKKNKNGSDDLTEQNSGAENDYRCAGNTDPSQNIEGTSWYYTFRSNQIDFILSMDVYNGYVTMSNECSLQGRSLTARVSVPARCDHRTIEVLSRDSDRRSISEPGFKMNCDVSVKPSRMDYAFKGRCLILTQPGAKDRLVLFPK